MYHLMKEMLMALLCIVDFSSDVQAASAMAHDKGNGDTNIHLLGYTAAGLLGCTVLVNFLIITCHRSCSKYDKVMEKMAKYHRHLNTFFYLLSITNSEIYNSYVELCKQDVEHFNEANQAIMDQSIVALKKWALISQCLEDIPQFSFQAASLYIQVSHGRQCSPSVLASVCYTLFMITVKGIMNLLALNLQVEAGMAILVEQRESDKRTVVKVWPHGDVLNIVFQLLVLVAGVVYLCFIQQEVALMWLCAATVSTQYVLSIWLSMIFIRSRQDDDPEERQSAEEAKRREAILRERFAKALGVYRLREDPLKGGLEQEAHEGARLLEAGSASDGPP